MNLYTYCHNNPLLNLDPSGHFILSSIIIGVAIGAVVSGGMSLYKESKSVGGISNMTSDNWKKVGKDTIIGGVCGGVGGGFGALGASAAGSLITSSATSSLIVSSTTSSLGYAVGTGMVGGMVGSYTSTITKQALYGYNDPNEIMQNTVYGGIIGGTSGALCYKLINSSYPSQKVNTSFYKTSSKTGRSLDAKGEPNTRVNLYDEQGIFKQSRFYGEDGKCFLDVDYAHSNGDNSHQFPHTHEWDWTKNPPRQDGKW